MVIGLRLNIVQIQTGHKEIVQEQSALNQHRGNVSNAALYAICADLAGGSFTSDRAGKF